MQARSLCNVGKGLVNKNLFKTALEKDVEVGA